MFHTKEGAWSLHISIKNHDTQTKKGEFIYVQGFNITWETAPSQT